ncbi:MAG: AAA family ATPase [uncultured Sulfurovum sp.]|uniref:AAA family ATPase n=1 Tax=uncultured Sulfurovum sp. TaxID=269237 RepID=A0A6S6TML0_9BACT|nr:MAG: AAA family ATPase [uncultured Sulfurovum sp.]
MESILYKSNPWWEEDYVFLGFSREIYLKQLSKYLKNKDILFLTGLRRVGKTSILKNFISELIQRKGVAPKEIFYISLDLYALDDYSIAEIVNEYRKIQKLRSSQKIYLFLDEVTSKKNYQQELKNFYDLENIKIFASSSSASLLKDKNAYLTGRQRIMEVMPLTFNEYLQFKEVSIKKADAHLYESYFEEYMQDGGMPEYVLTGDVTYLQNLIDNIISKDIIAHYNIRNNQVVKDFYKLLMERSGKQLTFNKIANILEISVDSARRYFYYFEETYLIYSVEKYGKLNERLKSAKKIYASDVGLRNVITGYRDKGAIFENLIYLQIKEQNPSYLYVDGIELDFITEDGILIEAKFNSVLNPRQQKLFDKFEAKEKLVVNGVDGFMELLV